MDEPLTSTAAPEIPLHQDLKLGARQIALEIYGEDTPETRRNVYRNPMGLSFFKHGNTIAALMSVIRAEIREAQRAAQNARQQMRAAKTRMVAMPRRSTGPNSR